MTGIAGRAGLRNLARLGLRAYDCLVLTGAVGLAFALSSKDGGCTRVAILPAVLVLAACVLVVNVWKPRHGYGTAGDLVGVAVCGVAGALTHAMGGIPAACPHAAQWLWLAALALIAAPRLVAGAVRARTQTPRREADEIVYQERDVATAKRLRTAWIICLSSAVDEPRARRQADALHEGGWNIVVFGYKGKAARPPYWTLIELPLPTAEVSGSAVGEFFRPLAMQLAMVGARVWAALADKYYWMEPAHAQALRRIARVSSDRGLQCQLICHHDYFTAPLAHALSGKMGAPVTADIHEYARGQFMDRPAFRHVTTHYVHALQSVHYPRSELLTVVCQGIADLLESEYRLKRKPLVVRNVSFYEGMPFREVGERIRVLYHGLVYEKRGLEEAIDSLPLWRPEFELVVRGPGTQAYLGSLRERARRLGVADRLRFEPAVPVTQLVSAANHADIGFFASASYSPQKRFTAPNKIFEYVMAGLALCVSDLPEMRRVVVQADLGRMFGDLEPRSIAQAINGFTRESIAECKRRSLNAARDLSWERERLQLIDAYDGVYQAVHGMGA